MSTYAQVMFNRKVVDEKLVQRKRLSKKIPTTILPSCTKLLRKDVKNISEMFGKANCKLCGDSVRFALRHLEEKHPETLKDRDVIKMNMSRIMERFFK
jgi:hypothetical protein